MKLRILGSGTSSGVPRIGNDWGVCDPTEARNRRTRASLLVASEHSRVLVDTSPDMRAQLLDANVAEVDAVIWTTCGNCSMRKGTRSTALRASKHWKASSFASVMPSSAATAIRPR